MRLSMSESLIVHPTTRLKNDDSFKEIIFILSATFKGSADQKCIDAFLGHDNLLSQISIT